MKKTGKLLLGKPYFKQLGHVLSLLYYKLVLLADTSFVLLKVFFSIDNHCVMGFILHTEKYSYLTEMIQICGFKSARRR